MLFDRDILYISNSVYGYAFAIALRCGVPILAISISLMLPWDTAYKLIVLIYMFDKAVKAVLRYHVECLKEEDLIQSALLNEQSRRIEADLKRARQIRIDLFRLCDAYESQLR